MMGNTGERRVVSAGFSRNRRFAGGVGCATLLASSSRDPAEDPRAQAACGRGGQAAGPGVGTTPSAASVRCASNHDPR
jgi:hypothetical protein